MSFYKSLLVLLAKSARNLDTVLWRRQHHWSLMIFQHHQQHFHLWRPPCFTKTWRTVRVSRISLNLTFVLKSHIILPDPRSQTVIDLWIITLLTCLVSFQIDSHHAVSYHNIAKTELHFIKYCLVHGYKKLLRHTCKNQNTLGLLLLKPQTFENS